MGINPNPVERNLLRFGSIVSASTVGRRMDNPLALAARLAASTGHPMRRMKDGLKMRWDIGRLGITSAPRSRPARSQSLFERPTARSRRPRAEIAIKSLPSRGPRPELDKSPSLRCRTSAERRHQPSYWVIPDVEGCAIWL
jgi:hypothetical protein